MIPIRSPRMYRWILSGTLICFCFVTLLTLPAVAQTAGAGNITGMVTDAAEAAVPGASVTVMNVDTGVAHGYTTDSVGLYSAPFLQPGHYKVTAKASNFGSVETKPLTLLVGQTLTINLALAVQSASTTVEVSGDTPLLDPQKTEVSQVLDQELLQTLPVAARNWSNFVLLTPNVVQDGGSGLISFHGISGLYNQNYVDGANNNQMLFSEAAAAPAAHRMCIRWIRSRSSRPRLRITLSNSARLPADR